MRAAIPNAITLTNLLFGCIGISLAAWGDLPGAARMLYLAAVMDFFDGFAARALNAQSAIGKDLDSLSDVVSFGVLPAFLLFQLAASVPGIEHTEYGVFVIALASALRLARFNHDTRQTDGFIGLPTPANGILIASLTIYFTSTTGSLDGLRKEYLLAASALLSYLLLSPIPMVAFKFKSFAWTGNQARYLFLLFSAVLLLWYSYLGLAFVILAYISWSFIGLLTKRSK